MGTTTALRREIKSRFVPHVEQDGFRLDEREAPTFWIFRRATDNAAQVFSIQWEKYGRPRFRLDFGSCPIEGLTFRGEHFDWSNMHPHWLQDVSTLKPSSGFFTGTWFRQDRGLLSRLFAGSLRPPSEVVDDLLALYSEVETYWRSRSVGKHIRQWPRR
ncbi:MAG: hypothetical protein ABL931_12325 [Usitatibacteraceae bacterium]